MKAEAEAAQNDKKKKKKDNKKAAPVQQEEPVKAAPAKAPKADDGFEMT